MNGGSSGGRQSSGYQEGWGGSSKGDSRGPAGGSKGVSFISAAASIPGYSSMTPAEQLKARMRMLMDVADMQNAAAAAAADDADVGGSAGGAAWTRFVLDKHGALDEDKHAMQQLLDQQVGQAGFAGGDSADVEGEVRAAFIMGTGRAAARRASAKSAAEQAHEDAIFGRGAQPGGYGGRQQQQRDGQAQLAWERPQQAQGGPSSEGPGAAAGADRDGDNAAATAVGLAEGLVAVQQKGLSWRERALAKRQQQL
jgi:hypothetical protein